VPKPADRRCEGIADFAARLAQVWQEPLFTAGFGEEVTKQHRAADDEPAQPPEPQEMIYDGGNGYIHVADQWTGFYLDNRDGPRTVNDPLWPLDALFGARNAVEIGTDHVRGTATTHYRVTIDLARADETLPAGVSVPQGPYRALSQIDAEVWLDPAGRARRIAVKTVTTSSRDREPIWSIVELWDFGIAADISVPGPGEIVLPHEAYQESPTSHSQS
jgi:hypothetical protein